MVHHCGVGLVEPSSQVLLGGSQADCVGNALTERTCMSRDRVTFTVIALCAYAVIRSQILNTLPLHR